MVKPRAAEAAIDHMGYALVMLFAAICVAIIASIVYSRGRGVSHGRMQVDKPVEVEKPAADEPTPAASRTAGDDRANRAQRRVPPA